MNSLGDTTRDPTATLATFTLDDLAIFTREKAFDPDVDARYRLFFVGRDDVHGVLRHLLSRVSLSLKMNMFGYDDDELDAVIHTLADDPHVTFQGTLDKSQAGGVHERKLLQGWPPTSRQSWVIGQSATHQISHTKGGVLDAKVAFEGSTNWSASGEGTGIMGVPGYKAQNNTLVVSTDRVFCARFAAQLDAEHLIALQQAKS